MSYQEFAYSVLLEEESNKDKWKRRAKKAAVTAGATLAGFHVGVRVGGKIGNKITKKSVAKAIETYRKRVGILNKNYSAAKRAVEKYQDRKFQKPSSKSGWSLHDKQKDAERLKNYKAEKDRTLAKLYKNKIEYKGAHRYVKTTIKRQRRHENIGEKIGGITGAGTGLYTGSRAFKKKED
jgi:hypothetical protein